eukprot:GHVL01014609.1.p1 GENE.GHVL01014609.1~~GHVL01014609.1.p1  ORF type:complete len:134 (+),score=12.46 GHVL01014609.1:608-1009(+)
MLLLSHDTKLWYSFAIAGVNVTGWLTEWVRNRDTRFRHIFYGTQLQASANILKEDLEKSTLILFGHMYSYIFSSFHEFWFRSEPASIMQFETLATRFRLGLELPKDCLVVDLPVENPYGRPPPRRLKENSRQD